MKRTKMGNSPDSKRSTTRTIVFVIALAFAGAALGLFLNSGSSVGVEASTSPAPTPRNQKRYIATKKIVVDKQTGQLRMPTTEETDKLVNDLSSLTDRGEDQPQVNTAGKGTTIEVGGGFGGVMLARPNADGTYETRCVFTFEEGAEFLGLVQDNPTE